MSALSVSGNLPSLGGVSPTPGLEGQTYKSVTAQAKWAVDFFKENYQITGRECAVLDLGCGDGRITKAIYGSFSATIEMVGIDVSESMLEQARTEKTEISFELGSAEDIRYEGYFDLLLSFSTLHFVSEQQNALRQIYQSLTSAGTALILVPEKNEKNMNPLAGKLITSEKWKDRFPLGFTPTRFYFSEEEYRKMLTEAGFTTIETKIISNEDRYPSKEAFIDSLCALLNYVPDDIKRSFAKDLMEKLEPIEESDGSILHLNRNLGIIAKK